MTESLLFPPLSGEEVVGFRVVPTIDSTAAASTKLSKSPAAPVPAILMLTQREDDETGDAHRQLKILRCPTPSDVSTWALEIGSLPDPRPALEVLPSATGAVTVRPQLPCLRVGIMVSL